MARLGFSAPVDWLAPEEVGHSPLVWPAGRPADKGKGVVGQKGVCLVGQRRQAWDQSQPARVRGNLWNVGGWAVPGSQTPSNPAMASPGPKVQCLCRPCCGPRLGLIPEEGAFLYCL